MIKVVKVDDFDAKMKRHDEAMETNEHYRQATESLTFAAGTKMELVIEVTDQFFSHNIMNLLHGKIPGMEMLGFKVTEVCMYPEGKMKNQLKAHLQKMIYELDNPPVLNQIIPTGVPPLVVASTTKVTNLNNLNIG